MQVVEARASAEKAQSLLKNVAERKKQKQALRQGLVILSAVYGDLKAYERGMDRTDRSEGSEDDDADLPPPYLDVGIPIQFLVDDFGQLRVCCMLFTTAYVVDGNGDFRIGISLVMKNAM